MPEIRDGFVSLISGQHSGIDPELLSQTQYARGINISSRKGLPQTRPRLTPLSVTDTLFTTGLFKGARTFHLNGADRIIAGVGDRVIGINLSTLAVTDYTAAAGVLMDGTADRYYFLQAEQYFIVQDGTNRPLILNPNGNDPDNARQAAAADEIPVGTIMAYGHGRIFVVITELPAGTAVGQRFIAAGDVMLPNNPATVLGFTETDYLAGGGALSLPNELGYIYAMDFMRNVRSGTGLGSMIVFALNGVSAFAVNAPRAQWPSIDLSQVLFTDVGFRSPDGVVAVNNDLVARARDGVRTIGYTVARVSGTSATLANEPISDEVDDFLALDDDSDLLYSSVANVDSRFLCTAVGDTAADGQWYFKSLVSLDSSNISSLGKQTPPAWDGGWTGLKFMRVMSAIRSNRKRVFVIARSSDNKNELYQLDDTEIVDGTDSEPICRVYTRSYDFFGEGIQIERLRFDRAELSFKDIEGDFTATVYYRPSGRSLWNSCNSVTISLDSASLPIKLEKLTFSPLDEQACDPVTKYPVRTSSEFQFCVQWQGKAKITKAVFIAGTGASQKQLACDFSLGEDKLEDGDSGFELDDFSYQIT